MRFYAFALILSGLFTAGCSLNYGNSTSVKESVPELVFEQAAFYRYQKGNLKMNLSSKSLEQYKSGDSYYASGASFYFRDDQGKLETSGSCGLLGIDNQEDIYLLFEGIEIENIPQKISLQAEALKWNGKTEQLTSDSNGKVMLKRDDLEFWGTGFSASGVSGMFSFESNVNGKIIASDSAAQ